MSEELKKWFDEYDENGNLVRRCRWETDIHGRRKKVCIAANG